MSDNTKYVELVGYAAGTLMGDDETELEVIIPDYTPNISGIVDESLSPESIELSLENSGSGTASTTLEIRSTVLCTYLGRRSNISIPNIHLGEQVTIWHIVGSDKYYWKELGRDDSIRTTEHIRFRIANKPKTLDELDDTTTYFIEMDTREGQRKIHISTSAGTGEEVTYDLLIDTDDSSFKLVDSVGNGFKLKSNPNGLGHWRVWNKENSFIDVYGEDIVRSASNSITDICKTYTTVCATHRVVAEVGTAVITPGSINLVSETLNATNTKTHLGGECLIGANISTAGGQAPNELVADGPKTGLDDNIEDAKSSEPAKDNEVITPPPVVPPSTPPNGSCVINGDTVITETLTVEKSTIIQGVFTAAVDSTFLGGIVVSGRADFLGGTTGDRT